MWSYYSLFDSLSRSYTKEERNNHRNKAVFIRAKTTLHKSKAVHSANVDNMGKYLEKLIKSESIASKEEFFENTVAFDGAADLMDKLDEAKERYQDENKS